MRSTGGIVYQIHFPGTIKFMLHLWCYIKPDLPILSTNNLYSSLLPLVHQMSLMKLPWPINLLPTEDWRHMKHIRWFSQCGERERERERERDLSCHYILRVLALGVTYHTLWEKIPQSLIQFNN